jgi:hypothetical protein
LISLVFESKFNGVASGDARDKVVLVNLNNLRWEQDMVQVYKIIKGFGKIEHEHFFEKAGNRAGMRTRLAAQANSLKVKKARTELRKNAFSMRVVKGWNSLPEEIREAVNTGSFKRGLRNFLENGGRPGYDEQATS